MADGILKMAASHDVGGLKGDASMPLGALLRALLCVCVAVCVVMCVAVFIVEGMVGMMKLAPA